MRWSFGCWLLTSLYVSTWTCWSLFDSEDCDLQRGRWCGLLQGCCALFWQGTVTDVMSTLGHSSPIWTYRANALGVVDLDLSLSPDAFGLRVFDNTKPLTRMLPGSSQCAGL